MIDDYKSKKNENAANDYETLLQKEEAAIRQHISYEHQIKIEYEKIIEKIEILELENKLLLYQVVSNNKYNIIFQSIQDKDKSEYEEKIQKLKKEITNNKTNFFKKKKELKELLEQKEKEIISLQTKLKAINIKNNYDPKNDNINNINNINTNNNSNMSLAFKSKANSSIYTTSKDDLDNKNKLDEFYTIFKENQINDNIINKNRTISNVYQSRNNNFFAMINRPKNKKNNLSQQNTIININSYQSKNYSTNNLRKNYPNSRKTNIMNSTRKKQNYKLNNFNGSSFNITNNTYNMNKNNIMINLGQKNANVSLEKIKVQKKLYEYQKLIDQKLNELIKNKHPHVKSNKLTYQLRQNSSPNIYLNNYNNSQRKINQSIIGLDYYLKKSKKKNISQNINTNQFQGNNSKKLIMKSTLELAQKKKINQKINSQSQSLRKNKSNSQNTNFLKQNVNKQNIKFKLGDLNNSRHSRQSKQENDSILNDGKSNLSLRKFIFSKCTNPVSHTINVQ